ncbi:MAG: DUF58 domain-containing protein [Eubacteriales bacterium]|nr:DUF58 domain-containing protein [Eubacteriales bacterium]
MTRERLGAAVSFLLLLLMLIALMVFTGSVWSLLGMLLMVLLPAVSAVANLYVRKHLRAGIEMATTTAKGTAIECIVHIYNDGWLPVVRCFTEVEITNDLTGEREKISLAGGAGARKSFTHSFLIQSRYCGRLYVAVRRISLMDYFGLISVKADVRASARITVLPELFPVDADMGTAASYSDDGVADRKGDDRSEVFALREYRAGDDVRQIHWKLSAKLDELIIREAGTPETRSLLVVWDKRINGTPAQMDALAEAVSSVCMGLTNNGILYSISWTGEEEPEIEDVADENGLLQAIPALVKNAGSPECRLPNMEQYSRILYFGVRPDDKLAEDFRFHFVICSDGDVSGATTFTPKNYKEILQRLEV